MQKRKICRKVRLGAAQPRGGLLLTDEQKDAIRADVRVDTDVIADRLASLYLGRTCPFTKEECTGPYCPLQTLPETIGWAPLARGLPISTEGMSPPP